MAESALPDILSGSEVESLLTTIRSFHHRVITMSAYGSRLRIGEACSLKAEDIDSKRLLIHIREGKRQRDRFVMLPERVLNWLREYWRTNAAGNSVLLGQCSGNRGIFSGPRPWRVKKRKGIYLA